MFFLALIHHQKVPWDAPAHPRLVGAGLVWAARVANHGTGMPRNMEAAAANGARG